MAVWTASKTELRAKSYGRFREKKSLNQCKPADRCTPNRPAGEDQVPNQCKSADRCHPNRPPGQAKTCQSDNAPQKSDHKLLSHIGTLQLHFIFDFEERKHTTTYLQVKSSLSLYNLNFTTSNQQFYIIDSNQPHLINHSSSSSVLFNLFECFCEDYCILNL